MMEVIMAATHIVVENKQEQCRACSRWQVRFVSLLNHKTLRTLCFESKAVKLDANTRFVIVGRVDCITVLAASTLSECFTISFCTTVISKCVPFSLGHRWIAFSDPKPIFHHLSRCGDASSDESEPLTSTMLNMNKARMYCEIFPSLRSFLSSKL
ncbi:unnamed protein product [Dicrocoelium dendriticum]|nr:unnamed protein product [Dicrocoelium dendriticum]